MFKKITALIVLVALVVNLMGYFVIFQCTQLLFRHEMADQIRAGTYSGKLENITVSKKSSEGILEFSDDGEFYFQGILYDVVASHSTGDSILYSCIQDKNEQSLVNKFTLFLHQHSGLTDTKKAKPILALIEHLLTQALVQNFFSQNTFSEKEFLFPILTYRISPVFIPDFYPPPKA